MDNSNIQDNGLILQMSEKEREALDKLVELTEELIKNSLIPYKEYHEYLGLKPDVLRGRVDAILYFTHLIHHDVISIGLKSEDISPVYHVRFIKYHEQLYPAFERYTGTPSLESQIAQKSGKPLISE